MEEQGNNNREERLMREGHRGYRGQTVSCAFRICTEAKWRLVTRLSGLGLEPLLRNGISYNPLFAGSYVNANQLSLLPE
jgi:hypothetical protein